MDKRTRIILIVVAVAAAAFLVYKYVKSKQQQNTGSGALGTNLNSQAPELVGGSTGPSLGPAVSLPINITLTEDSSGQTGTSTATAGGMQTTGSPQLESMNNPYYQRQPGKTGWTNGQPMQACNNTTPNQTNAQQSAAGWQQGSQQNWNSSQGSGSS